MLGNYKITIDKFQKQQYNGFTERGCKTMKMDEKKIALYMKNLSLTREEAIQTIIDEEEDNFPELTTEQKKVEKAMMRADRKEETAPRKRERKPDDDKRFLIRYLIDAIDGTCDALDPIHVINPEREIEFTYHGTLYRLTLAKPRKKGE